MANQNITPEVEAVLRRSTITGNNLVLPQGQLERKLYESVNKVLVMSGGKWNRSAQAHVFQSDPRAKLGLALETGVVIDKKKETQAFYTPSALADEVVQMANVKDCMVLEPSAGRGALVEACARAGCRGVKCIEKDPESAAALTADGIPSVVCGDFLDIMPGRKYERIVMNPPFTRGQDVKHIEHALKWLSPGGILVSIMSAGSSTEKVASVLDGRAESWSMRPVEAGAFKESGTNIPTVILLLKLKD